MITQEKREYSTQIVEVDGVVGVLTLNLPARLNAINDELMREMIEALGWLDGHPELRVAILRGSGRAFSARADLKEIPGGPSASRAAIAGSLGVASDRSGGGWMRFKICRQLRSPRCTARRLVVESC
jgi:enoyl-CoA hydratase/carnithine racemase